MTYQEYTMRYGNIFVTHANKHHTDDIASISMLTKLGATVRRLTRLDFLEFKDNIPPFMLKISEASTGCGKPIPTQFDMGGGYYDHHQSGSEVRASGIPYSAYGLLFRDFGREWAELVIGNHPQFDEILNRYDREVVSLIDASDNGYPVKTFEYKWLLHALIIADRSSESALVVQSLLEGCLHEVRMACEADKHINQCLKDVVEGLLVLDMGCSFIQQVRNYNSTKNDDKDLVRWVVHPNDDGWTIRCQPSILSDSTYIQLLPYEWLKNPPEGCYNNGKTFVHKNLFMATFETKDQAINAAYRIIPDYARRQKERNL